VIGEINLNGVFLSPLLVFAVLAYLATAVMTRLLARVGFYRLVWHRALFDVALFVIVWGAMTAVSAALRTPALGGG